MEEETKSVTSDTATEEVKEVGQESVDTESQNKKYPYPKSVFFIVSNEFCERFSYYGMRALLVLYFTTILHFTDDDAKMIYHVFSALVYFFPLLGAIVSDSFLGKFKTIFILSIVYAGGSVLLTLAAIEQIHFPQKEMTLLALLLIAIGTGGIKPCVAAFGGDQFRIPEQEQQLSQFFSLFYFAINSGSLISTIITPIFRDKVKCFGREDCYPLSYAVPGALMILSVVIFVLGRPLYKVKKPEGNVVLHVTKCIAHAVKQKFKSKDKVDHWLDRASDKYDKKLIEDIKATLGVLVLYIPLPIYWSLFDQQGSDWTLQAVKTQGDLGGWTILPEQVQVINPLLILSFIPLFTYGVYPLFARCNMLTKPLTRMTVGGLLASLSFVVSAILYIVIEKDLPVLPESGKIQLRAYNPINAPVKLSIVGISGVSSVNLDAMAYYENIDIAFKKGLVKFSANNIPNSGEKELLEDKAYGVYVTRTDVLIYEDDIKKPETSKPLVRTLGSKNSTFEYMDSDGNSQLQVKNESLYEIDAGKYKINGVEVKFAIGGIYTVLVDVDDKKVEVVSVVKENTISILWMIPQYFVITAGEIMFSVTGLEFSYSQAPASMKSVVQAAWLLTTAIGNFVVVLITAAIKMEKESYNSFLYAGLMFADMILFYWLARSYKYKKPENDSSASETPEEKRKSIQ